jgi:hypothetical protein
MGYGGEMSMNEKQESKKEYQAPLITQVKLEDRRVVAMAVCKDSLDNRACAQDGVTPLFDINPS